MRFWWRNVQRCKVCVLGKRRAWQSVHVVVPPEKCDFTWLVHPARPSLRGAREPCRDPTRWCVNVSKVRGAVLFHVMHRRSVPCSAFDFRRSSSCTANPRGTNRKKQCGKPVSADMGTHEESQSRVTVQQNRALRSPFRLISPSRGGRELQTKQELRRIAHDAGHNSTGHQIINDLVCVKGE